MAEVRVDFTISTDKQLLTIIDTILEAIEDVGMYGLESELDEESRELEVSASAVDLDRVCGWTAILQKVFSENNIGTFSIKVKGVTDNDYYSVEVYEGSKTVVMSGMFSGKSYKQSYKVRNGVYSLTGDRISVKPVFVTADEEAELDRMRSNYSSIEEKLQKYESEPEKMDILNSSDYANIADQANFNELKKQENHFDLTVDEVKEKADAMLLQYAKSGKLNFAVNEQPKDEPKKDFFAFARVEHNTSFLDGLLKSRM